MDAEAVPAAAAASRLRACLNCAIIKPASYFKQYGCPNCPFLQINQGRNLLLATSASFRGTIGLIDPKPSWVARWQRLDGGVPGTYAMTVEGELGDALIEQVEREGRVYFNRARPFELE